MSTTISMEELRVALGVRVGLIPDDPRARTQIVSSVHIFSDTYAIRIPNMTEIRDFVN